MIKSNRGFTVLEALFAITLGAMVIALAVPSFVEILGRSRHGSAVRRLVSDLREARAQAIATGWEFRVVGYDSGASSEHHNQYRILARRSSAVAWPDEEAAPFASDTQKAERWVDLVSDYPGVEFDSEDTSFEVTFDSRGTAPGASDTFNPLRLVGPNGTERSLTVSVVGGIRVE